MHKRSRQATWVVFEHTGYSVLDSKIDKYILVLGLANLK